MEDAKEVAKRWLTPGGSMAWDDVMRTCDLLATALLAAPEAKDTVAVPVETLKRWKESLGRHWFGSDGEDEYNNDEIIAMDGEISALLPQPLPTK